METDYFAGILAGLNQHQLVFRHPRQPEVFLLRTGIKYRIHSFSESSVLRPYASSLTGLRAGIMYVVAKALIFFVQALVAGGTICFS
jgi:hypothetical protein